MKSFSRILKKHGLNHIQIAAWYKLPPKNCTEYLVAINILTACKNEISMENCFRLFYVISRNAGSPDLPKLHFASFEKLWKNSSNFFDAENPIKNVRNNLLYKDHIKILRIVFFFKKRCPVYPIFLSILKNEKEQAWIRFICF